MHERPPPLLSSVRRAQRLVASRQCAMTREDAVRKLATFIEQHPEVQDEVGLRLYDDGRPSGEHESATDVLGEQATHQHLG